MMAVVGVVDRTQPRPRVTWMTLIYAATIAVGAALVFLHYYRLAGVPGGAFVDEVEVFWNAQGIALDGHDAHGNAWPLFFQPFSKYDDWKNPIMIYGVALVFRFFGASMAIERAVPSTFSLAAAALLGILAWLMTRNRWFGIGTALVASATPWLFTIGRDGFETAALPMTLAGFLCVWLLASQRRSWRLAFPAGLLLGFSLYAYTTARLYVPLLCLALVVAELPRFRWRLILAAGTGAALMAIPMALFMHAHPDALTSRFETISIFAHQPSKLATLGSLWRVYTSGFAPNFLFGSNFGQIGGELFSLLMPVMAIGLIGFWRNRRDPFYRFAFLGLLLAPVSGALTTDFSHVLRNIEAVPFYGVLAVAGVRELLPLLRGHRAIGLVMIALLVFQGGWFLSDYFVNAQADLAGWQEDAMPQVAAYLRGHHYAGPVDVSYSAQGGNETLAFWEHEPVQTVRAHGTGSIVMYDDQGVVPVPGTVILATVGDTPKGADFVKAFYTANPDGWGGATMVPQLELWVVPY